MSFLEQAGSGEGTFSKSGGVQVHVKKTTEKLF